MDKTHYRCPFCGIEFKKNVAQLEKNEKYEPLFDDFSDLSPEEAAKLNQEYKADVLSLKQKYDVDGENLNLETLVCEKCGKKASFLSYFESLSKLPISLRNHLLTKQSNVPEYNEVELDVLDSLVEDGRLSDYIAEGLIFEEKGTYYWSTKNKESISESSLDDLYELFEFVDEYQKGTEEMYKELDMYSKGFKNVLRYSNIKIILDYIIEWRKSGITLDKAEEVVYQLEDKNPQEKEALKNWALGYYVSYFFPALSFYSLYGVPLEVNIYNMIQGINIAFEKFDRSKGFSFERYAAWWAKTKVAQGLNEYLNVKLEPFDRRFPIHAYEDITKICSSEEYETFMVKNHRLPNEQEYKELFGNKNISYRVFEGIMNNKRKYLSPYALDDELYEKVQYRHCRFPFSDEVVFRIMDKYTVMYNDKEYTFYGLLKKITGIRPETNVFFHILLAVTISRIPIYEFMQ